MNKERAKYLTTLLIIYALIATLFFVYDAIERNELTQQYCAPFASQLPYDGEFFTEERFGPNDVCCKWQNMHENETHQPLIPDYEKQCAWVYYPR